MKLYKELHNAFSWRNDPKLNSQRAESQSSQVIKKLEAELQDKNHSVKQAKDYIQELETVVEKSKDNILFLKELVIGKDAKYQKAIGEMKVYKQLSEMHIAESSKLAKELISVRSSMSKVFTSPEKQSTKQHDFVRNRY